VGDREREIADLRDAIAFAEARIWRILSPDRYGHEAIQNGSPKCPAGQKYAELREDLEDMELRIVSLELLNAPVMDALSRLPPQQQKVLRGRYFDRLTQTETAGKLKISRQHVHRLEWRGVKRLERYIEINS
jgi:RNA polymerase sigma factor (sigma-70 family)